MSGKRAFWTGARPPLREGIYDGVDRSRHRSARVKEPSSNRTAAGLERLRSAKRKVRSRRYDDLRRPEEHPPGLRAVARLCGVRIQLPFRRYVRGLVSC